MRIHFTFLLLSLFLTACRTVLPSAPPATLPGATAALFPTTAAPQLEIPATPTGLSSEQPTIPTSTPMVPTITRAPGAGVSPALVSARGQVAFIQDSVLFIEETPGAQRFAEIARFVRFARWSPDGSRLLYDQNATTSPDNTRAGAFIEDFRLWSTEDKQAVSITTLIENFPAPPYLLDGWIPRHESGPAAFRPEWIDYAWKMDTTIWSPGSDKILFVNLVSPERLPVSFPGSQTVSIADLERGEFWLAAEALLISAIFPLDANSFLLQDHCGSPCEWLTGYDLQGNKRWELPWVTTGFFALAPDRQSLVNAGRIAINEPTQPNTIDAINTRDGAVRTVWTLEGEDYFPLQSELSRVLLSPDGLLASFNIARGTPSGEEYYLAVIDMLGNVHALIPNAIGISWSPLGELAILQLPDVSKLGEVQLARWKLGESAAQPFFEPTQVALTEGVWSPDGRSFAYCVFDPASQSNQVFAWLIERNEIVDVLSAPSPAGRLCNLTWLPDSSAFFFNLSFPDGMLTALDLWHFHLSTGELSTIARSAILP